jgi:O-antigen/teichoic acid export membrane protein
MDLRQRLLGQSTVIFGGRIFGAALTFLAQAAIARFWGPELLGEYLLIIAAVNLVAVVMPLGFETTGTYFAAEYRARGEGRLLRGFMVRAYAHVAVTGAIVFALGSAGVQFLGEPGRVLQAHLVPACLMALATAVVFVNSSVLVGLKRPFSGLLCESIFRPMVVLLAFAVATLAVSTSAGFVQMVWWLAAGFVGIAIFQFGFVLRAVRTVPAEVPERGNEPARWWRFALPWVVIALATDYFFDLDLLLLANLLSREELAIFGVCARVFALVAFGVSAVYIVTLPDMFESEAMKDRAGFHRKIGDANLVAAGIAVALFAAVAVLGPFLLMLFGPSFAVGAAPLAVLCLALVVRCALGPAALVLSIHDRPYASLPSIGLGLVSLVLANLLLVPRFGLMGAAVAALIAITLWSLALWWTALKHAGIDVSIFARLRRGPAGHSVGTGFSVLD